MFIVVGSIVITGLDNCIYFRIFKDKVMIFWIMMLFVEHFDAFNLNQLIINKEWPIT